MTNKLLQLKPLIATNDMIATAIGEKIVRELRLKKVAKRAGYFFLEDRAMTAGNIARHLFTIFEHAHFATDSELVGDTIAELGDIHSAEDKRHYLTVNGKKTAAELATCVADIMLCCARKLPIHEYLRQRDQDGLFLAGNELDWVGDIGEAMRHSFAEINKESEALGDGEQWAHLSVIADARR